MRIPIQAAAAPETTALTSTQAAARHRKLKDAAEQFEAMFLQQMLQSKGVDGESATDAASEEGGAGGGMMKGFGQEFVAKAVAHAGGLGIARHVVAQVEKTSAAKVSGQP